MKLFTLTNEQAIKALAENVKLFNKGWHNEKDASDIGEIILYLQSGKVESAQRYFNNLETCPRDICADILKSL